MDDVYESKLEDDCFRGKILLEIFLDAMKFGFKIGFSCSQLKIWVTILKKTHISYFGIFQDLNVDSIKQGKGSGELKCIEIFKSELLQNLRSSKIFLDIDLQRMIDYFRTM